MTTGPVPDLAAAEAALAAIPSRFPGPGGVAGIVHRGRVVARAAWGWANPAQRGPMTTATRLPVCSITKQFTCAALLDALPDPSTLDGRVRDLLPRLETPLPTVAQLAHNQSGLRDSWALTVLMGAQPDGRFAQPEARPLFARMRSGHFLPGTQYSYANGNFRLLSELLEDATGRSIGEHYARLFERFGMAGAALDADTARPLDGVVGHEGGPASGWVPAVNRIWWQGDAGIAASLDDMLAYERAIDSGDPLLARLAAPVTFADGRPASYGWGLARETVAGVRVTGHGGALRGFRAQRFHAAAQRLSVVVMLNHEASAHAAAASVLRAALGAKAASPAVTGQEGGAWLDPATGLLLTLDPCGTAHFATSAEPMVRDGQGWSSATMILRPQGEDMAITRPRENLATVARPVTGEAARDIAGSYACAETASRMVVSETAGVFWAGFEGPLGRGPMEPMEPVGQDLWALWTRRGMDAPAPGRWTVQVRREAGRIKGLTVSSWLARQLNFQLI